MTTVRGGLAEGPSPEYEPALGGPPVRVYSWIKWGVALMAALLVAVDGG